MEAPHGGVGGVPDDVAAPLPPAARMPGAVATREAVVAGISSRGTPPMSMLTQGANMTLTMVSSPSRRPTRLTPDGGDGDEDDDDGGGSMPCLPCMEDTTSLKRSRVTDTTSWTWE